jgi:hypothetical protein
VHDWVISSAATSPIPKAIIAGTEPGAVATGSIYAKGGWHILYENVLHLQWLLSFAERLLSEMRELLAPDRPGRYRFRVDLR